MHIVRDYQTFLEDDQIVTYYQNISETLFISSSIVCHTTHMLEYQKELYEDLFSELSDELRKEEVSFNALRKRFEDLLQHTNLQLQSFAEKMTGEEQFRYTGHIQIVVDGDYLATCIGQCGLVILRGDELQYTMTNPASQHTSVDQFSELIEGEVRIDDTLVMTAVSLDTYVDDEDLLTIIASAKSQSSTFANLLKDILEVRVEEGAIGYIESITLESNMQHTQKEIKSRMEGPKKAIIAKLGGVERAKTYAMLVVAAAVVAVLISGIVGSFQKANNTTFVADDGASVINISIEDIQREIGRFERIEASSDEKITAYNEIIAKLDLLEENNKWTYDVQQFRKQLQQEYLNGFNIVAVNSTDIFSNDSYVFTQQEKNILDTPKDVFFTDGLFVAGSEGALLNAVTSSVRGTLVGAPIDTTMDVCSLNLLSNGLYCVADSGDLYNITGGGFNPVTTNGGAPFPNAITDIGRFGSGNMYLLTNDEGLADGTHVIRYRNQLGSQETFDAGTQYRISDTEATFDDAGLNSMAIDGTFLVWSPVDKGLYQLWRDPPTGSDFTYRKVEMSGGTSLSSFSEETEVIAFQDSRLVYFFDQPSQTFTVYRSLPFKTNDANTYSYTLSYFFQFSFDLAEGDIIDAFVQEGEQSRLYLLHADGVYTVQLSDFVQQFFERENN